MDAVGGESVQVVVLLAGILIALIGVIGAMVKMWPAIHDARAHAEATNYAVNNIGPGDHKLYDVVSSVKHDVALLLQRQASVNEDLKYLTDAQREFESKGWNSLPADIGTAPALTEKIRSLEETGRTIQHSLDDLRTFLEEHDKWERSEKYSQR